MREVLEKYRVAHVWHFTDMKNVQSMADNGGIFSLAESIRRGIQIAAPGGNEWSQSEDTRLGLHEYVHLTFLDNHPMAFIARQEQRISELVWLKIDASVLLEPDVRFCAGVANKAGAEILTVEQAIENIDFESMYTYTDWTVRENHERRKLAEKSEILVPTFIPKSKIIGYRNG